MKLTYAIVVGIIMMIVLSQTLHAAHAREDNTSQEPGVVEVQKRALAYHYMEDDEIPRWKKRARMSALLPKLQIGYDRRVKNDVNIDISEKIYVGSSGVTVGPDAGSYAEKANSDQNVGVKAVWSLNELIFNSDQLDISREARNIMRERQALMAEVNGHYHERQRLRGVIEALEGGRVVPFDDGPQAKKRGRYGDASVIDSRHQLFLARVRFDEETAALDALTGGWFSAHIGR